MVVKARESAGSSLIQGSLKRGPDVDLDLLASYRLMMKSNRGMETIAALASPPGNGAIGIIRISGPQAHNVLARLGACPLKPRRLHHRVVFGPDGERLDQIMVCWMPAPKSFTGENVAEIYAHGGRRNMQRMLKATLAAGCRRADPGEFSKRAFLNGKLDLAQAEAISAVIRANSERSLRNAHALLAGALGDRLSQVEEELVEAAADLDAAVDFAEEISDRSGNQASAEQILIGAWRPLAELLQQAANSPHLEGLSVAITGPVNAGKSTLFNALLGRERSVVSAEASTTIDYVEEKIDLDGVEVTLVDTAGSRAREPRETISAKERRGMRFGDERSARCDFRWLLFEAPSHQQWLADISPGHLLVVTKMDLVDSASAERLKSAIKEHGIRDWICTSAKTGEGIAELRQQLSTLALGNATEEPELLVVTEQRQLDSLARAEKEIRLSLCSIRAQAPPEISREHLRLAMEALEEIRGKNYESSILDRVFSRFCIGK